RFVGGLEAQAEAVRASQRAWLAERDQTCGMIDGDALIDCLTTSYENRLATLSALAATAPHQPVAWLGDWSNMANELTIKVRGDAVRCKGESTYSPPNVCDVGPNTGEFDGTLPLNALAASSFTARGEGCQLRLELQGALLVVKQLFAESCAGLNVDFDGYYSQGGVATNLICD
ncbi:MAG: lysozyme inhibitor LprI family protein, partial [Thiohalocapsa sp.]